MGYPNGTRESEGPIQQRKHADLRSPPRARSADSRRFGAPSSQGTIFIRHSARVPSAQTLRTGAERADHANDATRKSDDHGRSLPAISRSCSHASPLPPRPIWSSRSRPQLEGLQSALGRRNRTPPQLAELATALARETKSFERIPSGSPGWKPSMLGFWKAFPPGSSVQSPALRHLPPSRPARKVHRVHRASLLQPEFSIQT
jgi:hypothetical protein